MASPTWNISNLVTVKLTEDNFILWRSQIYPALRGYNLFGFVNGSRRCPPEFLNEGGRCQPNEAFDSWICQDQMLLSWINSTLSEGILSQVVGLHTSAEVWQFLETRFSSPSRSHISQLKDQLQSLKKGDLSITEYLKKVKKITDSLASTSHHLDDEDIIHHILSGLPPEYHLFKTSIRVQKAPITVADLCSLLVSEELNQEMTNSMASKSDSTANSFSSAFYTHRGGGSSNRGRGGRNQGFPLGFGNHNQGRGGSNWRSQGSQNGSTQNFFNRSFNPVNGESSSSNQRSVCQIYNRPGHNALDCYHRMDFTYQGRHPPSHLAALAAYYSGSESVKDNQTKTSLYKGKVRNGMYILDSVSSQFSPSSPSSAFVSNKASLTLWHSRLGHPSRSVVKASIQSENLYECSNVVCFCEACQLGKISKLPFSISNTVVSGPFHLLHSDVWGPVNPVSGTGFKYYVTFIDHFTRYIWIFPRKCKSDVYKIFVSFYQFVLIQFGVSIKVLRTDGGGEYCNSKFLEFMLSKGMFHQLTCPHTPEQNGVAERKHRHIVETGITLLVHASMSASYWVDAFFTSVYLINRMPSKVLNMISPFEALFGTKPDYSILRVFGCACYPWLRPYVTSKVEPRSIRCIFLGYCSQQKGYRCLDVTSSRVYVSRHVKFDETFFPFSNVSSNSSKSDDVSSVHSTSSSLVGPIVTKSSVSPSFTSTSSNNLTQPMSTPIPRNMNTNEADEVLSTSSTHSAQNESSVSIDNTTQHNEHIESVEEPASETSISSTQESQPPTGHSMVTKSKDGISKKKVLSTQLVNGICQEPSCFSKAITCPEWRKAMQEEYEALQSQHTWDLVPLPSGANVVDNKWVYRIKYKSDGTLARYKARLMARGFLQEYGIDYLEIFSPVVKHTIVRILLTLAVQFNWPLQQLDVSNAFLHGFLQETIYMKQPRGFVDRDHPDYVCKLQKSLYGLKQAPRAWYDRIATFLLGIGFTCSQADTSLFIYHDGFTLLIITIYVDDIIVTGNNSKAIQDLLSLLSQNFEMKCLGDLHYFLGLEIHRNDKGIFLSQKKYAVDILHKAGLSDAKSTPTPSCTTVKLTKWSGTPMDDPTKYRSIVGALQYLTLTRPDLVYAVNKVCQYMSSPTTDHWVAVKRILRYVKGSLDAGVQLSKCDMSLVAFSDSDWAGDINDRRSMTGFCVFLGCSPISWSAKKQPIVARSSTEAEYRALAYTTAELAWINQLLKDLHIPILNQPKIWCDNISSIYLASNPIFHARTKHIEVDYHYIIDKVLRGDLTVLYIPTQEQLAYLFTKSLSVSQFYYLCNKLMLRKRRHQFEEG